MTPVNLQTYHPPCPGCGRLVRRVGFVPDADCVFCRVDVYRCDFCELRSVTTVCSFWKGQNKPVILREIGRGTRAAG